MKTLLMIVAIVLLWGMCGKYAHDRVLFDFTAEFPDQCHDGIADSAFIFGPVAALDEAINGRGGKMDVGYTKQQRWDVFKKQYSSLGLDYFNQHDCEPTVPVNP